jgi:hypothetical protein
MPSSKVRAALGALGVILLTESTHAQGMSHGAKGSRQQNDQQTAQKKQQAEALDKAYRAGLDRIPDNTKKQDPWDNMRDHAPSSNGTRPK